MEESAPLDLSECSQPWEKILRSVDAMVSSSSSEGYVLLLLRFCDLDFL
jgi:hypothetical protein